MEEFKKLGLSDKTIKILSKKGFTKPTQIQEQAIPILLNKKQDIIGQAQTGTGKTASFALPIIERIKDTNQVQALILTPTRELAMQVTKEIESLSEGISCLAVYGGAPINNQISRLKSGVKIVVGTPGRIIDLIKRKVLKIKNIDYAVLDEADEMLNMGFIEDIEQILSNTNSDKQTLLFSATMPRPILNIAKKYMKDLVHISIKKENITTDLIEQHHIEIQSKDRIELLKRIIDLTPDFYGIIFCKTKLRVDFVASHLIEKKYSAAALHGDVSQQQREQILNQFRKNKITILVATDVAARGIDVNDLTHVVNFSLPQSPEQYIHRIGRTGRAGKKGIAITFLIPSEKRKLSLVERTNNIKIPKAKIPSVKEVITYKENNLYEKIIKTIEKTTENEKFDLFITELLNKYNSRKIINALLNYNFKQELSANTYKDIQEVITRKGGDSSFKRNSRGRGRSRGPRRDNNYKKDNNSRRDSSNNKDKNTSKNKNKKPRYKDKKRN
jgi:ATP-dependent RNA helicase DeaD